MAASARRLRYVVELTPIDDGALAGCLAGRASSPPPLPALAARLAALPDADWERGVLAAVEHGQESRAAMLGESMTELDFRARRWARVPRVCASLASSFGFLLATVSLRVGLANVVSPAGESTEVSVNTAVLDAVDVVAIGLVGAAFCAAIQYRSRALLSLRMTGAGRLVDLLDSLSPEAVSPLAAGGGRGSLPAPESSGPVPCAR